MVGGEDVDEQMLHAAAFLVYLEDWLVEQHSCELALVEALQAALELERILRGCVNLARLHAESHELHEALSLEVVVEPLLQEEVRAIIEAIIVTFHILHCQFD